jgi:peptidoglycan biosynthesis protein MviN/MurJ (putative lipid II flippase)
MNMNPATCGVLATVFPIVMLTVVLERRTIALKLRRIRWFRSIMLWSFSAAAIGLGITLAGVQAGGLGGNPVGVTWAVLGWIAAVISLGGLSAVLMASMASTEVEEDAASE